MSRWERLVMWARNLGRPPLLCWDCGYLYPTRHRRTEDEDRCTHPWH